ncbi:23405_t:CDS:2 [Cetraspora pellucida]|uniref:23405_t:CDS:1 n=1 Tax=Cetraspora pellucida TaxID=1433469 RepID=A0A9N9DFG6_9GLOM|nr:23405_t:CDS:2 [Cetraspora pellucida]
MLAQNVGLLENIYNCVEFALEEKYELYISEQTLLTYFWPKHLNTFSAKQYYYSQWFKFAGIVLPIDHFGAHLNSQGKVIDKELAIKNFYFLEKKLCDIW